MGANDVIGPNGAIPAFNGGSYHKNITTSAIVQVKDSAGVLERLGINTGGTSSKVVLYDGLSSAVTITIASPAVVSWPAHGLPAGTAVEFTTTGALPTGLVAGTKYYVSVTGLTADAFQVADTQAHALAGTNSIDTTGTQSGAHTGWDVGDPVGTYATTSQNSLAIEAACLDGIIALPTDGGGAADLTVFYV